MHNSRLCYVLSGCISVCNFSETTGGILIQKFSNFFSVKCVYRQVDTCKGGDIFWCFQCFMFLIFDHLLFP